MAEQTILWTALPAGEQDGTLRVSICVSPRLTPPAETTLQASFPDFATWRAHALSFRLRFGPGADDVTEPVAAAPPTEAQVALWSALFGQDTRVEPFAFEQHFATVFVNSYPVLNVLAQVEEQYATLGAAPASVEQFPTVVQLLGSDRLRPLAFAWQITGDPRLRVSPRDGELPAARRLREAVGAARSQGQRALTPAGPDRELDFWRVRAIHRPLNAPRKITERKTGAVYDGHKRAEVSAPSLDFHRALAALGEHPPLLRELGLIVDLEFPAGALPATGVLAVDGVESTPPLAASTRHVRPGTLYGDGFRAQTAPGSALVGPLLDAGQPDIGLVQVDVDGAAHKLINLADTLARSLSARHHTVDSPTRASLPSLRSAGFALVRTGRANALVQRLDDSVALDAVIEPDPQDPDGVPPSGQPELRADDLVRGYAIDVREAGPAPGPWRSLCRRRVTYRAPGVTWPPDAPAEDEGWTTLAATSAADGSTADLNLTEALMRWEGWSLCVRRPGQHVGIDDEPADYEATADNELGLAIDVAAVPGSLPRLRFGRSYQLRARAVDLAGNALPRDDPSDVGSTAAEAYRRFEPLVAPALVLRSKPLAGESLERVAIRSLNSAPNLDNVPTTEVAERHVAPPAASQLLCETHGAFDDMAPGDAWTLIADHEGTFADADNPRPGGPPFAPLEAIETIDLGGKAGGETLLRLDEQLALPYLPDPLFGGAGFLGRPGEGPDAFLGLPGAPLNKQHEHHPDGGVTITDLNTSAPPEKPPITLIEVDAGGPGTWPGLEPFRLRVTEGADEPKWDAAARVLTVSLPKGEIARVRLSSWLQTDALDLLGVWAWIADQPVSPATDKRLRQLALSGRHWMLTPHRELVLVHAVEQPLITPDLTGLAATRAIGSTTATLSTPQPVAVHSKSTLKLDLEAAWTDPVDDETAPAPELAAPRAAHAYQVPVPMREGMPVDQQPDAVDVTGDHEFGDTRHHLVRYRAVATTRFREYLDDHSAITRSSAEVEVSVPSSARPASPTVLYAVPTFRWERPEAQGNAPRTSTRRPGGLRIYLDRTWFSSGAGEQLGVVCTPGRGLPPAELLPYVTLWGADPVRASAVPDPAPTTARFPLAVGARAKLTLEELEGTSHTVAVAPHAVAYDPRRRLWFADVDVDAGDAMLPFIRLALARYQADSVEEPAPGEPLGFRNVHLSRVVLAEFLQLTPERVATLSFPSRTQVQVSLAGPGLAAGEFEVEIQVPRTDLGGELGWRRAVAAEEIFLATPDHRRFAATLPAARGSSPMRLVLREREGGAEGPGRFLYAETFAL